MQSLSTNRSVVDITTYLEHRTDRGLNDIALGINRAPSATAVVIREMLRSGMLTAKKDRYTPRVVYNLAKNK